MSDNKKSNLDESLIAEMLANRVNGEGPAAAPVVEEIAEELTEAVDSGLTEAGKNAADIIDSFMNVGESKEAVQKQLNAEFNAVRENFRPAPENPADSPLDVGDVFLDSKKSLDEVINIEDYKEPAPAEPVVEEPAPEEPAEPVVEEPVVEEVAEPEEPVVAEVEEPAATEPADERIKANIAELDRFADEMLQEGFSATATATAKSIAALSEALARSTNTSFVPKSGDSTDKASDSSAAETGTPDSISDEVKKTCGVDILENGDETNKGKLDANRVDNIDSDGNIVSSEENNAALDEEEEVSGSILKTIIYTILTIALLIAAILSVGLTVAKDTGFGRAVQSGVDKVQAIFEGEEEAAEPAESVEAENAEATDSTSTNTSGSATGTTATGTDAAANVDATAEQTAAEEGSEHAQIQVTDSVIGKAIQEQVEKSKNIELITEDQELKFPAFTISGADGADKALAFDDDLWYVHNNTENIHYSTEIVGFAIDYYSKLMERYNNGNEDILKMIEKDTMLMNGISAIKSDHLIKHTITKMDIGEMRKLDDQLYLILTITEKTSDQKADSTYTKVMHFDTTNKDLKVKEIGDATKIG